VANYNSGLQIVDIAEPQRPRLVGSYDTPGLAHGVAVAGDYAYLASGDLYIINIANPKAPYLAGDYHTPGGAISVAVAGNHCYVADDQGFLILQVER